MPIPPAKLKRHDRCASPFTFVPRRRTFFAMPQQKIRVTIWNEGRHEKRSPHVAALYPKGIHGALADHLNRSGDFIVLTGVLDDPHHGLQEQLVNDTDVMLWWGHLHHVEVADDVVER